MISMQYYARNKKNFPQICLILFIKRTSLRINPSYSEVPNLVCNMNIRSFSIKKFTNQEIKEKQNLPEYIQKFFQPLYFNKKKKFMNLFAHSIQIEIIEDCDDFLDEK